MLWLTDIKLKDNLSSEALRLVDKELSWEKVSKETVKVYQKIMDKYYISQYLDNQILSVN